MLAIKVIGIIAMWVCPTYVAIQYLVWYLYAKTFEKLYQKIEDATPHAIAEEFPYSLNRSPFIMGVGMAVMRSIEVASHRIAGIATSMFWYATSSMRVNMNQYWRDYVYKLRFLVAFDVYEFVTDVDKERQNSQVSIYRDFLNVENLRARHSYDVIKRGCEFISTEQHSKEETVQHKSYLQTANAVDQSLMSEQLASAMPLIETLRIMEGSDHRHCDSQVKQKTLLPDELKVASSHELYEILVTTYRYLTDPGELSLRLDVSEYNNFLIDGVDVKFMGFGSLHDHLIIRASSMGYLEFKKNHRDVSALYVEMRKRLDTRLEDEREYGENLETSMADNIQIGDENDRYRKASEHQMDSYRASNLGRSL